MHRWPQEKVKIEGEQGEGLRPQPLSSSWPICGHPDILPKEAFLGGLSEHWVSSPNGGKGRVNVRGSWHVANVTNLRMPFLLPPLSS